MRNQYDTSSGPSPSPNTAKVNDEEGSGGSGSRGTQSFVLLPLIDWVNGIIKFLGPSLYSMVSMIVQGNVVSAPRPMRTIIKEALVKVGPMPRLPPGVSNEMIFAAVKEGVKVKMAQMMDADLIEKKGTKLLQELFFKALESQIKDRFF